MDRMTRGLGKTPKSGRKSGVPPFALGIENTSARNNDATKCQNLGKVQMSHFRQGRCRISKKGGPVGLD